MSGEGEYMDSSNRQNHLSVDIHDGRPHWRRSGRGHPAAFTLIELLTVVFIISLLIGILIPAVNGARNAAKKATTAKTLDSIKVGLEMFKNDNGSDFRQTNGYPPSFAHPRIPGYPFLSHEGRFPFYDPVSSSTPPVVFGAHWLPAMLMGVDNLGYVKRSRVPKDMRDEPWCWYPNPQGTTCSTTGTIDRMPLYLDPGNTRTRPTEALPGRPNRVLFPDWDWDQQNANRESRLPVIVDAFDQPILYYVANKHGRVSNMVEDIHLLTNALYDRTEEQQKGVPYYFHQDNQGFTGTSSDPDDTAQLGWDFGGRPKGHAIGSSGALLDPLQLVNNANRETFARNIVDRQLFGALGESPLVTRPLRPVNADTYLLISAGRDGRYGTSNDVTNMPPWPD